MEPIGGKGEGKKTIGGERWYSKEGERISE
jgi:hypothetical protein